MPHCRRTSWPLVVGIVIALPLLYFASVGSAMWLAEKAPLAKRPVALIYWPLERFAVSSRICRYLALWKFQDGAMADGWMESIVFYVPIGPDNSWGSISYQRDMPIPAARLRLAAVTREIEFWKKNRDRDAECCENE